MVCKWSSQGFKFGGWELGTLFSMMNLGWDPEHNRRSWIAMQRVVEPARFLRKPSPTALWY